VIRTDLELRYQDEETQTLLRIATYLDPRFKSLSFLDQVEKLQVKMDVKHKETEVRAIIESGISTTSEKAERELHTYESEVFISL